LGVSRAARGCLFLGGLPVLILYPTTVESYSPIVAE